MAPDTSAKVARMPGGSRVPLGLGYLTVAGAHPVEQIEAAAAAGFANVGLRLVAPLGLAVGHDIVADATLRRDVRAALERTGVTVYDVDVVTLAADTDGGSLQRVLDVAAGLGATVVQVVVEDRELGRARTRFADLCDRAAELGLGVSLEFMKWRSLPTLADAAAFVNGANRPNATLCIDCLHLSRCGDSPAAVAALPPALIGYVQLCDAAAAIPPLEAIVAEARGGRMHPGEGGLWLHDLLDAVPPGTPLSLEVPRAVDVSRAPPERARLAAAATRRFLAARSALQWAAE